MNQKQSELSIPYRRNANQFSSSQLKFFYENIVLRCENDEKPLKYFYINSIEIKQLKQKYDFELTHKKKVKGFTITTVPHNNDFVFVDDKHAAITSLLYHIRNAFVHNRVRLLDNGEVEIMDVVPARHMNKNELEKLKQSGKQRPKPRITMYAKVLSFSKFKNIIIGILATQR